MNIVRIKYHRLIKYCDSIKFIRDSTELDYDYITENDLPLLLNDFNEINHYYDYTNHIEYVNIDCESFNTEELLNIRNALIFRLRKDKLKQIENL